jgi:hypothetical protein
MLRLACVVSSIVLLACGPSKGGHGGGSGDDDDTKVDAPSPTGGGPDAYVGPTGSVSGRVWMPNYAPGLVPAGQEIPVYGAVITLTQNKLAPIPDHAYCEECVDTPGAKTSAHDGSFSITAPVGTYWLTIQKGQFRLEEQVMVKEGTLALTAAQTSLPSQYDPAHGAWIPKVAVAVGNYDAVEDILGKIGFGTMDAANTGLQSGAGEHGAEIDLYQYDSDGVKNLIGDIKNLRKYHIVFFPCSTEMEVLDAELSMQANLKVLRQYVNEGGKIYVTDWSGEFADRPFPPQLTLGGGHDSTGTYDAKTLDGTLTKAGDADGSLYDTTGSVNDADLATWLGAQSSPDPVSGTPAMIDPHAFKVVDNFNTITKLTKVQVGTDPQGLPTYDDPKAWLSGPPKAGAAPLPLSVTFEPTGCGRVLYSTYQTSGADASDKHVGLTAQERVLLYLIMELQVCHEVVVN